MNKNNIKNIITLGIFICLLPLLSLSCSKNVENVDTESEVIQACDQSIDDIYNDIVNIKDGFKELEGFGEKNKKDKGIPNDSCYGTSIIWYEHNVRIEPKKRTIIGDNGLHLVIVVETIYYTHLWQQRPLFTRSYKNIDVGVFVIIDTYNADLKRRLIEIVERNIAPLELMDKQIP